MGRLFDFALLLVTVTSLACAWNESSGADGTATAGDETRGTGSAGETGATSGTSMGETGATSGEPTGTGGSTTSEASTTATDVIDCPKTINDKYYDYDGDGILDIFLDDQGDVALLAGCTDLHGSLIIRYDVSDLTPLASLRHIAGKLFIRGSGANFDPVLTSLAGLEGLRSVGGLDFEYVTIQSLEPLAGLTEIPGDVEIVEFIDLTSLEGLHNIEQIGGSLRIDAGYDLHDLNGLRGLKRVGRDLLFGEIKVNDLHGLEGLTEVGAPGGEESRVTLYYLTELTSLDALAIDWHDAHSLWIYRTDISSLSTFAGTPELRSLRLTDNEILKDLAGLESLEVVHDELVLDDNDSLTDIGALAELRAVGALTLAASPLTDLSLPALEQVGDVRISGNPQLTALSGLAGFASLGSLVLEFNPVLAALPEFSALAQVDGNLEIRKIGALTTLVDVAAVTSVGGRLVVVINPELLQSEAEAWGEAILVGEDRKIAGNKGDPDPPADPCPWKDDGECDDTLNGIGICAAGTDGWECLSD